ncbi:DNA-binding transcriptional regulator, ArsR family [Actinopolymorpha singaporensis]|uniref:DNA-binding transcriptional regulator, ArsR family n=2 Tax=Actinopolymorpha singaporensis TaxID=117157 RepID=A0A1H1WLM2_9ACTN|nr:DNA-binding transcriptional regulator, ArsR family [Actinopolymorpha singaporensis]
MPAWLYSGMATTFEVLAEPTRRRILDLLLERPRSVGELVDELRLSQPGTSKHLRVLRDSGFVRVRQDAQRRWYEIRPEPLAEVDAWLAPYRRLWEHHLDALERHLDAMAEPGADAGADSGLDQGPDTGSDGDPGGGS